ncbi:MAG: TonB-dependent receptor, partial [Bryobacteraceae bacterium]
GVQSMIQLGSNPDDRDRDRSWVFSEALTFQNGRHTLKMGGDFRRQMYNNYSPGKLSGSYAFAPSFTAFPGQNKTGYPFADLLLGLPTSTSINLNDYTYRLNINSASLYLQDDFKVLPKLTLNLGLRWEFDGPYSEANGQFASFNPSVVNATTGTPGDVQFAGRNGAPEHFSPNVFYNFLPRVGFAWNVAPKTVIRGGYGIYRFPSIGFAGYGPASQYAVNATFMSLDNNVTPAYQLANGVPPYPYNVNAAGLPNIPASLTKPTSTPTELDTRSRTPYTQNWEFGVQRQISNSWFGEVDYEANRGTKLPVVLPQNQLLPAQFGPGNLQSLRPFPQYLNINGLLNEGNSTYHSLQAKLEHRWTSGFLLSVGYTFSKLIDDVDGPARTNSVGIQNGYNLKAERGIGGYDIPQRFVANYVYQIPIGRGGRYLNGAPVLKDIIGGWSFAGITEFQVGLPLTIKQASNNLGGFTAVQRPMQIAPAAVGHFDRTVQSWFNTAAFVASPQFILGNAPRFPLHGPGINNTDFALMRDFKVQERFVLQFRGEFYNALNHPNFGAPGNTIGAANFGVITSAQAGRITELALRIFF